jgi:hypothetical protein
VIAKAWYGGESVEEDRRRGSGEEGLAEGHHLANGARARYAQRRRKAEHRWKAGSGWAGRR